MLFRFTTFKNKHHQAKTGRTVLATVMLWIILLSLVMPLQAGRNLFRPDKSDKNTDSSSGNSEDSKADQNTATKLNLIGQSFQQKNTNFDTKYYIFIAVIFVLVIALIYFLQKFYNERKEHLLDDPLMLFRELCAAHQLSQPEQQLLQNIAKQQGLNDPLPLFIEPQHLHSALNNEQFKAIRSMIELFLKKLFDLIPQMEETSISVHNNVDTTIIYKS